MQKKTASIKTNVKLNKSIFINDVTIKLSIKNINTKLDLCSTIFSKYFMIITL